MGQMAEVLSTVGLLIDVAAVAGLIVLGLAESGGPASLGPKNDLLGALRIKAKRLRCHKAMLWGYCGCALGLFVGTGLLVASIWV